jgi:CPA2 family monovalent cation:H+ antiporter-2
MLLLVPVLGGKAAFDYVVIAKLGGAISILVGAIWLMGRRGQFELPLSVWFKADADMQPMAVLAICFSAATLSGLLGLMPAYGAFLAGLVLGNSNAQAGTLRVIKPIQSVLLVVFFLSIGLLIDLRFIWRNLTIVLALLAAVTLIKTVINIAALRVLGQKREVAFPAGVIMGQIGEFSFVLAAAGLATRALDRSGYRLAISVIALSLLISPVWQLMARRFHALARSGAPSIRGSFALMFAREIGAINRALGRSSAGAPPNSRKPDGGA